jgi:ATP-dependent RNA helicase RhlE
MDPRITVGHARGGHELKKPQKSEPSGFAVFGLRPELLRTVEKLGWTLPSPVQHEAIPHAMAGHDLIGIAQTGTGKTGAYVLPLLQALSSRPKAKALHPYCVILAPTRELVQQIDSQVKLLSQGLGVRSMTIFGGVSDRPQISQLLAGVELITATPGRLLDLIGQGMVHFEQISHCVLDEADRMFDMGFIQDLKRILNRMPVRRQTLLFSATMPPEIQRLTAEFLYQPREVRLGAEAPPPELSHEVWEINSVQKNAALDALLAEDYDCVLIFTRTKHRADTVARRLGRNGESVALLHGNRSQNQRDQALARFKQGQARVLVATDVASRGLDIVGIGLVVNYDAPRDPDDYVHRVGRTARAKRPGRAITLLAQDEFQYIRKVEQMLKQRIARRKQELPAVESCVAAEKTARPAWDGGYISDRPQPRHEPRREPRGQRQPDARSEPRGDAPAGSDKPAERDAQPGTKPSPTAKRRMRRRRF